MSLRFAQRHRHHSLFSMEVFKERAAESSPMFAGDLMTDMRMSPSRNRQPCITCCVLLLEAAEDRVTLPQRTMP
jgi:hypothetical protein